MHLFTCECPFFLNVLGSKIETSLLSTAQYFRSAYSTSKNDLEEGRATEQIEKVLSLCVHLVSFPPPPSLNIFPS